MVVAISTRQINNSLPDSQSFSISGLRRYSEILSPFDITRHTTRYKHRITTELVANQCRFTGLVNNDAGAYKFGLKSI